MFSEFHARCNAGGYFTGGAKGFTSCIHKGVPCFCKAYLKVCLPRHIRYDVGWNLSRKVNCHQSGCNRMEHVDHL